MVPLSLSIVGTGKIKMDELKLEGFALTHEGKVRDNNEDNFYLFGTYKQDITQNRWNVVKMVRGNKQLAAVFDGMGGEEAGEVVARMAVQEVMPCEIEKVNKEAERQLVAVNEKVCEIMRQRGIRMGATAVLIYFDQGKAKCVNLGDSRAYLFREHILRQISVDHSEGQRLIDLGIATKEQAKKSREWHRLTQHIGIFPEEFIIEPFFSDEIILKEGDLFIICSDGLTDMLCDEEIRKCLNENTKISNQYPLQKIAEQLLEEALDRSGKDNITILLIRVK